MEIITKFLNAMQMLLLVKVVLFLGIGLILAGVGIAKKNRWLVGLGVLVAFGQFVWPWFFNASYENRIASRRATVLAMPKTPIPSNYPRRLIIEGDASNMPPAGWFIALGYVDEVDQDGKRLVAARGAKGCREAAISLSDPSAREEPAGERIRRIIEQKHSELSPHQQLMACTVPEGLVVPGADGIILRTGGETQLWDRAAARLTGAPSAVQVSVRLGGRESLAHYDEMPALGYQSSSVELLAPGYEYPCSGFNYSQIVANLLDGARQPGLRTQLMQRGENMQRAKYDPCIASKAPVRAQDVKE